MRTRLLLPLALVLAGCPKPDPDPATLQINPSTISLFRGDVVQLIATGTWVDGSHRDVTTEVAWTVDDLYVAQIDGAGELTAFHDGTTTVRARFGARETSRPLTVAGARLVGLDVEPDHPVLPVGLGVAPIVTGLQSDGVKVDLTSETGWSSLAPDIALFENGLIFGRKIGATTVAASARGQVVPVPVDVTPATVKAIDVQPSMLTLANGFSARLSATALLDDGSSLDVSTQVQWSSSNPALASFSMVPGEQNLVVARALGHVTLTAKHGTHTDTVSLTVTDANLTGLELSPAVTSLALGTNVDFHLLGVFSDATVLDLTSQAQWSSSGPAVAIDQLGHARALAVGRATLTAAAGGRSIDRPLTVTAAQLTAIELSPDPVAVAVGMSTDTRAVGVFSDGTRQEITAQAVWQIADANLAHVGNGPTTSGRVTGLLPGATRVSATLQGVTGSAVLTVSSAVLTSLQVTPAAVSLPVGTRQLFTATGLFSDGSTSDLTAQATWASSDSSRVSISSQGRLRGEAFALAAGDATITATFGASQAQALVTVTGAVLTRVEVTPAPLLVPQGANRQLTARGFYSDGASADLTTQVTWAIDDATIATLSNASGTRGQVQGLMMGMATASATLGNVHGSAPVFVTAATLVRVELSPANPSLAVGFEQQLTAISTWTDGSTLDLTTSCVFTSSAPAVAQVANMGHPGLAHALAVGQAVITATCSTQQATATLTVTPAQLMSLTLMPASVSLPLGTQTRLRADGVFSDGTTQDVTTQVAWSSDAPAVAQVSNAAGTEGQVTALTLGNATVHAQLGTRTATVPVAVSSAMLTALELSPSQPTVPLGAAQPFTATGRFSDGSTQDLTTRATWTSSAAAVLTVSNAVGTEGVATARTRGAATLTATVSSVQASTLVTVSEAMLARVDVSPNPVRLAKLTRTRLTATGIWSDGSSQDVSSTCTWSSADHAIATVSNAAGLRGLVDATGPGATVITATCAGQSGTAQVTVTDASLVQLSVTPASPTAPAGFTLPLTATAVFSDGTSQPFTDFVSWSSANPSLATVSNAPGSEGLVTALRQGSVVIAATALGFTQPVNFVVSAAMLQSLEVQPVTASIPRGLGLDLVAFGHFSDGSVSPVTTIAVWTSAQPTIAAVSNASGSQGHVSALNEGSTVITADVGGVVGSTTVSVSQASLVSLAVTPFAPSVPRGLSQSFVATGTFTDGTTRDLTSTVSWASESPAIATVSNAAGSRGLAQALDVGTTTVRATSAGIVGATTLTVTAAQLAMLQLSAPLTIPHGLGAQLAATGVYTDGTTQDLTPQATFTSSAPGVASVSNVDGSRGLVSALQQGSAVITATFGALSGTTQVTVSAAVLQSIALTPPTPSVAAGLSLTLIATGTFSDGSTLDLTSSANWSSNLNALATVSQGVVTGRAAGLAVISASQSGVTGSVSFTVTAGVLQSLQVTPANTARPKGLPQQFTATGVFSDASVQDLTGAVTWASSTPAKVSISNAGGSRGLASTLGVGAVTITASLGGISGSTPFTVTAAQPVSLAVVPGNGNAPLGSVRQYAALATWTDGSTQFVTAQTAWTSSAPGIATISNTAGSRGLATTLAIGSTTIGASWSGFSASSTLNVTQSALTRIDLTPANGSTALGYTRQFIATGTYTDGTTQLLTDVVTWGSSDDAVAFISNAAGSRGLLSTVQTGTVTLSATWNGVTGTTSHTVSPAVLVYLVLAPQSVNVSVGGNARAYASGLFSDGSTQDLTSSVTWVSSDPSVAQVSNAVGTEGLVSGITSGISTLTASQGMVSASLNVVVN